MKSRAELNAAIEAANNLPLGTLAAYGRTTEEGRRKLRKKFPGVRRLNREARGQYRDQDGAPVLDIEESDEGEASASPGAVRWLALGASMRLLVPGQQPLACRYAVARVGDLIASHDPLHGFAANPRYPWSNSRDYLRQVALQAPVWRDAASLSAPHLLDLGGSAENGPPVVAESGAVAGGNSRAMKLAIACRRGGAVWQAYVGELRDSANRFGLTGATEWPQDAVLVRLLPRLDAATLDRLIPLLNESAAQAESTDEGAFALARGLTNRVIAGLSGVACSEGQTLRQALRRAGVEAYNSVERAGGIPLGRRNRYVDDAAGELTGEGLDALEGAIMARMTGGNLDLFKSLPPALKQVAIRAAGPLLEIKTAVAEGLLPKCADVTEAFNRALQQAAETGRDPDQGNLFAGTDLASSAVETAMGRLLATLSAKRGGMDSGPAMRELAALLTRYRSDLGQDAFGDSLDVEGVVEAIRTVEEMAA